MIGIRTVITGIIFAALSLGADGNGTQTKQIIDKCVDRMSKSVRLRSSYTYKFLEKTNDLDRAGHVKDTHSKLVEILYFGGKPYDRLLAKDGKALDANEQSREEAKMSRAAADASNLTDFQREERQAKIDRERQKQNEWLRYVPEAYHFEPRPDVMLEGRPTYVIDAHPREEYGGKYAGMLRKTQGKLFIDKQDYTLARMEADVLDTISFGLFLARLSKGTRITFEQVRINDEVWLPKNATVHADARALVKTYRVDQTLVFSDYRKFQSESHIIPMLDEEEVQQMHVSGAEHQFQ